MRASGSGMRRASRPGCSRRGRHISRAAVLIAAAAIVLGGAPVAARGPSGGLTPTEQAVLGSLDVGGAIEQLAAITRFGERVVGTEAEHNAQQYVRDTLAALPLDEVVVETFPTTSWTHSGDRLRVVSPVDEEIPTSIYGSDHGIWGRWFGARYALGNDDGGRILRARLVDVGLGTAASFDAAGSVDGAIVLARRDDDVQGWSTVIAEEASRRGALAVVNYGYYGDIENPEGIKQDANGAPIPEFAISPNAAAHLRDLVAAGPVTVELQGRADAVTEEVGRAVNVIGYLRGTTRPDEYIVISGHVDCWWTGANDNASSVAAVLELARVLSEARRTGSFSSERTIVFASFAGEEFGGPSGTWYNWLNGSYAFVKAHPEIMAGLVIDLNSDIIAFARGPGKYWMESTWEVDGFLGDALGDLGLNGQVGTYSPVYSWTDAWSLAAKGGGSAVDGTWVAAYDAIYHTQLDDLSRVDPDAFGTILRLYALMAVRADGALVLPLDLAATVAWADGALSSERAAVPYLSGAFERAAAALGELRAAVAAANARAGELRAAYDAARTDAERAAVRAEADALNEALIDARRTLTTWSLGEGGTMGSWDVFMRPDQHVHDMAAIDAAVAALSNGKGNVRAALGSLKQVYSMEWGHLYGPATYRALMDQMINDDMNWGGEFDQQQAYVDVHAIHRGLADGSLSPRAAVSALDAIRRSQLLPWLEEDLQTLERAWLEAAAKL